MSIRTPQLERAVVNHFGFRQNMIVPNVSFGFGLKYEADLVVVRPSKWAVEIELKVSRSDLIADKRKKWFAHVNNKFRQLWFAMPEDIVDEEHIPANAGILAYCNDFKIKTIRGANINKNARKLTDKEIMTLGNLGCMRIWSLKQKLNSNKEKIK